MKKNKGIILAIAGGAAALAIIAAVTVFFTVKQNRETEYTQQMRVARLGLDGASYENIVNAYETAIELKPDDPDAYLELAEFYLDQEEYYEANAVAEKGQTATGDSRFSTMIAKIRDSRLEQQSADDGEEESSTGGYVQLSENENLVLKSYMINILSTYCYQQYVNEYGEANVSFVSDEEGYRVKFNGLNAYAYYKNTADDKDVIDTINLLPAKVYKPYKILVTNPSLILVGFDGGIAYDQLCEIFDQDPGVVQNDSPGADTLTSDYYIEFLYMDCYLQFESDSEGNVDPDSAQILIRPQNLLTSWEEEEEPEVTEEPEEEATPDTFVLAGQTYTYDITELIIYSETLDDLSPLSQCKSLQYIAFFDCEIADMSPLSGCTALQELVLDGSYGGIELEPLRNLPLLQSLHFHECADITTIEPIMDMDLTLLHVCGSSVSWEETEEYMMLHPDCEVWFDYYLQN